MFRFALWLPGLHHTNTADTYISDICWKILWDSLATYNESYPLQQIADC